MRRVPLTFSREIAALCVASALAGCGPAGEAASTTRGFFRAKRPVPGRYIVVLKDSVAKAEVPRRAATAAQQAGGRVHRLYGSALKGYAIELSEREALALAAQPEVAFVEEDGRVEALATRPAASWGQDRIDQRSLPLDGLYTHGSSGAGVHAYVIDTGVRPTHVELVGRAFLGFSSYGPPETAVDCHGHGTHVAGIIAGSSFGIAPLATIHSVRVLDCSGSGLYSDVVAGIDWVAASHQKPAVANMSLGGGRSEALNLAVARSVAAGVTYVVAAGNEAGDACQTSPASEPSALTVGAAGADDAVAFFSNQGPCVDLFAPGRDIPSAWVASDTATKVFSGTSMAAPHVAGVAALYLHDHPAATPEEVAAAIGGQGTGGALTGLRLGSPDRLLYSGFLPPAADASPPVVALVSPPDGATLAGDVDLAADAADDVGVALVRFEVDGLPVGGAFAPPWRVTLDTERLPNGPHQLVAVALDDALQEGRSLARAVTVANVGMAVYDSALGAPACAATGPRCDSGVLLVGRGLLGPEPNQPNTIFPRCLDAPYGLVGDPSIDAIQVEVIGGGDLAAGRAARVSVRGVGEAPGPAWVDVFLAADVDAPDWRLVGSLPFLATRQTVSADVALADSPRQVVRAGYRTVGEPSPCAPGQNVDYDDLVFAVAPGIPDVVPPSVSIDVPAVGEARPRTVLFQATASDDVVVNRVEFLVDGAAVAKVWAAPYQAVWSPPDVGTYTVVARAVDGAGNVAEASASLPVIDPEPARVSMRILSSSVTPPALAVSGKAVAVSIEARDNLGVTGCELHADGVLVAASPSPRLDATWNAAAGVHRLVAYATDTVGNVASTSADVLVDDAAPSLRIVSPGPGQVLSGAIVVLADASDDDEVAEVFAEVDGLRVAADRVPPFELPIDTAREPDGTREIAVVARDRAGNATSVRLPVEFRNPSSAARDAALGVPACAVAVATCDSTRLLEGSGFGERDSPNTLGAECADPSWDGIAEVQAIRVSSLDGAPMAAGLPVLLEVRVDPGPVLATRLDLYQSAEPGASPTAWRFLESLVPAPGREQVLQAVFVLASTPRQAVRAKMHEVEAWEPAGDPPACDPRTWYRRDDHDDLVFEVTP